MRKIRSESIVRVAIFALAFAASMAAFQNCSKVDMRSDGAAALNSGNGEGYSGKPTHYVYKDPLNPCAADASGVPLSNADLFDDGQLKLVRQNCADVAPRALAASEYAISGDGRAISFAGATFAPAASDAGPSLFAPRCPAGRALIANAVPANLFADSQNLLGLAWFRHLGIGVSLEGSIAGLPFFSIAR